ncbi:MULTISPECIES: MDR family MFS transporter [Clostridium]|uniref:MDR family MFS transporter n=1 Tax=Clostridium TaxID=1485 RepID=UPI000824EFED|nr:MULTISPECIES: MDR family MFS transporter [Clostridium]PJI08342.1 MFS transporter [Clostridium sp. CT7]
MNKKAKYIGFIGILISAFLGVIDSTIVNIALPDITNYFNVSLKDTSWISTIYALALAVFMITASKIADQFGRKKLMIIGLIIFGVSSALCGFSSSLLFLIVMRFIQGIGGAIITPIVLPMGIEIFGKEKMQIVVGASGAVVGLAAASGPPVGGILIKYINWQSVFFVNVPLTIISLVMILLFVEESYDNTVSKSIDWLGMITLTISLFCLTFALLKGKDYGWTSTTIIVLFTTFVVSLIAFIIIELKLSEPMVELKLFKEPTFTASNICYLITGFGLMCPLLILNYYLQNVLNYDTLEAAFIMMTVSLTAMVATPTGSILSKKIGTRIVNFIGILMLGIGTFRLSYLSVNTTKGTMIFDLIICGIGLGFSVQALSSSVKYIPKEKSGMGSGIINAARQIGSCIGIAILVSMLNGNVSSAKDDIKKDAISYINNKHEIIYPVRKKLVKIINDEFNDSDSNSKSNMSQASIQKSIQSTILKNSDLFSKDATFVNNDTLKKLYDATSKLRDANGKIYNGEENLNNGISSLKGGMDSIYSGGNSLNSGIGTFNTGINKVAEGSQKLKDASDNLPNLVNGISELDAGAKKLLMQFSPGNGSVTLYDGASGINNGAQKLSSGVNSYVTAVNNMMYLMIKNNPDSNKMLEIYENNLNTAKAQNDNSKIAMLSSLVTVYSAALDPKVTNESDFENKLNSMGTQNIVASGTAVKSGASGVAVASSKVLSQFQDGGNFKSGVIQISSGLDKVSAGSQGLLKLQTGIGNMNDVVSKLKNGSSKLYDGSNKVTAGMKVAKDGTEKLKDGSDKLVDASLKVKDGTQKIVESEGMAGQKGALQEVLNKVKDDKNEKISEAFNKTFSFASIIIMLSSVLGLLTDKKVNNKNDIKSNDNLSQKVI